MIKKKIRKLAQEHSQYQQRLENLIQKKYLSEDEKLEEVQLKKLKLRLFFFSSRRRHTICLSDWISDVCSSDLPVVPAHKTFPPATFFAADQWMNRDDQQALSMQVGITIDCLNLTGFAAARSEERRLRK